MQTSLPKIVVDCERMKYPNTGLYQFCRHLSLSLISTNRKKQNLCFYVPLDYMNAFGDDECYIKQRSVHKRFFPSIKDVALWHSTHQSTDYFPFNRKVKKLLTIHDLNYLHDETKKASKVKQFKSELTRKLNEVDALVFISQFALDDFKTHFDLSQKPCHVIYNGCTILPLSVLNPPDFLPAKPFLFSIGTIARKKGFHVLPRLLPGNDFDLVIAGITQDASYKQKIEEEAKKLGVLNRLYFTGAVSENDKQWYLKNCSAFVFPSLAEGFGLPVVEAMYFGKPILLSSSTSLPEIGGDAANYFSSFDATAMQKDLTMALQRHSNNHSLATELHQRALSFSWDEAASRYLDLYSSLIAY